MRMKEGKLVLIGAGMVGSATLNAILAQSVVSEIVVIDANEDKALGEVLDALHTTSFAYSTNTTIRVGNAILAQSVVSEIVVIDANEDKALGEVLDALHTTSFAYSTNTTIRVGSYADCADASIIVMTAGPSIQAGDNDRRVLAEKNIAVMDAVMAEITRYTRSAILIVVTNPVDLVTYFAQTKYNYPADKIFGTGTLLDTARMRQLIAAQCDLIVVTNPVDLVTYFAQTKYNYPADKIFGTGTLLDTARMRQLIAAQCDVDSKNVHGYLLGEHGESAFIPWSMVNVAGIPVDELPRAFGLSAALDKEKILASA